MICGDGIAEIGGQKKLLQLVYGNGFAEIVEKKLFDFWQWHCRNRRKKNLLQLVCVNGITEIVGKKIVRMNL